jgi:rubrerythrin
MKDGLTLQSVLSRAIQKEIESQGLYRDLAITAHDDAAREILFQLVEAERKHEALLRRYQRGELGNGALKPEYVVDYKIVEHLEQSPVTPGMRPEEVLLFAANREKVTRDFYLALAAVHPPGEVKTLLEELAAQELDHKQRAEYLYTEIAFPQTDGG